MNIRWIECSKQKSFNTLNVSTVNSDQYYESLVTINFLQRQVSVFDIQILFCLNTIWIHRSEFNKLLTFLHFCSPEFAQVWTEMKETGSRMWPQLNTIARKHLFEMIKHSFWDLQSHSKPIRSTHVLSVVNHDLIVHIFLSTKSVPNVDLDSYYEDLFAYLSSPSP